MGRDLTFDFPLPNGLHARPATALAGVAARFAATVTWSNRRTGREGNARSVLALVATLTRHGDSCTVHVDGPDEAEAAAALERVVRTGLAAFDAVAPLPAAPAAAALPRALAKAGARVLRGVAVSPGVAVAPVVTMRPGTASVDLDAGQGSPAEERARLTTALARVEGELGRRSAAAANATERAVLAAHLAILADAELVAMLEAQVAAGESAARAVAETAEHFSSLLAQGGTAYLKERAVDLEDLAAQVIRELHPGAGGEAGVDLADGAVLVADDCAPSLLLSLDRTRLAGLALAGGGPTSHTAVLARALGVPCVMGLLGVDRALTAGQEVVLDGGRGLLVVDPSPAVRAFYAREAAMSATRAARQAARRDVPGATADGRRVEVVANVASPEEARAAFADGAEGVGLFRTELLFMGRDAPPSEDEQAEAFTATVRLAAGRPVTFRTLDVGGDKPVSYLGLPAEANPYLGWRGVRLYAAHRELVAAQVRAVLRAGAAGPVRVMAPMVSCLEEVRAFRELVAAAAADLAARGVAHDPGVRVGIMVEVPAAAELVDVLAAEVDFLSIGSNDLAQYLTAAERGNPRVAALASPYHPALWRVLARVAAGAHAASRPVGLCGELGGKAALAPLLVALGLDELSMASLAVPAMKAALARCGEAECAQLLRRVLVCRTAAEVEAAVSGFATRRGGAPLLAPELVVLDSEAGSRDEAVRELVDTLHLAGRVDDPDAVEDAVWRREETCSTGVGCGVAIPHCASPDVLVDSVAVARFARAVEWESLDGEGVLMAILVAVRPDSGDAHLRALAGLSRRLMDEEFRAALLGAADPGTVTALLASATGVA